MSKNHNNYNRNNYSKMYAAKEEETVTEILETVDEPVVEQEVVEVSESIVVPEIIPAAKIVDEGIVSNCAKLNIRSAPSTDAEIITVLYAGTKLMVDPEDHSDWYSICTLHGIEGFCMKKFVTIQK